MAFQKKLDATTEKTIQLGGKDKDGRANPTSVEGYYLGAKDTDGQYGPGKLHIFQTKTGNVGVWGKTNSNRLLTGDLVGQMVRLTFTGMSEAAKGRRPAYKFHVEFDEENTINTTGVDVNTTVVDAEDDVDTSSDYQDDDTVVDEVPYTPPARPARAAVAASAEDQARVQTLLRVNRAKR